MNTETRRALKQTPKIAGGEYMVMGGNRLNGYPAAVSQHMPNNIVLGNGNGLSALIYGNFYDIVILTWDAMDIHHSLYICLQVADFLVIPPGLVRPRGATITTRS